MAVRQVSAGRYSATGNARRGGKDIHADAEQPSRAVAQDRQDRGRAGHCAGRSQVPVSAFFVGEGGVMESELGRAQRRLLEFCDGITIWEEWDMSEDDPEIDLVKMKELVLAWKMAEILDTARKIA